VSLRSPVDTDVHVIMGDDCSVEEGVILGYRPGRRVSNLELRVGSHAHIRSGTVIYAGSTIGTNLETGHNVVIREENSIGDHLNIWNGSTIDYGCIIGHKVKIHCNVYVAQFTTLEDEVFLAPGVTIANDLHPQCGLCMRGPTIKRGARIGANVTLLPHLTIGEWTLIGAGSVVTQDIPANSVAYGNPARVRGSLADLKCLFDLSAVPYLDGVDIRTRGHHLRSEP